MLLTLTTTHRPADDLSFLLHKHPERFQTFDLSFGRAHVFYPEVGPERASACLMLEVDAVGLVRREGRGAGFPLEPYVNDRPYVASSFLSVAIAQVLRSAMGGRSKERAELAATPIPLEARLETLPVRGDDGFVRDIFEPMGYAVEITRRPLDERFPDWGESPCVALTIRKVTTVAELLTHLYVLIPVFDARKHYYVGADELEKLLAHGAGWLAAHPLKEAIARRYLDFRRGLYREALDRLAVDEPSSESEDEREKSAARAEERIEAPLSLNECRLKAVGETVRALGATSALDLGCGEGKLIRELLAESTPSRIVGMDVSFRALDVARRRLRMDRPDHGRPERVELIHGSLLYRDRRFAGFDVATVVEVIEHLDPPRLSAFERTVFEFARPRAVIVTTPNREFNVTWESLPAGRFRHADHRFEWSRAEFQAWSERVAARFGYRVRFAPIGPEHAEFGPPTQMAVFERDADSTTDGS